jgi:hypothetical protein
MTAAEAAAIHAKLAELRFAVGSQTLERVELALRQLEAGCFSFGFMIREGVIFDTADGILAMMLTAISEVRQATQNLCDGLDELVPVEAYADWMAGNVDLDALGYTREKLLTLREKFRGDDAGSL